VGDHSAALVLAGDDWTAAIAGTAGTVSGVEVYVPGVGPAAPAGTEASEFAVGAPEPRDPTAPAADSRQRERIRELAHSRLRHAVSGPGPGPAPGDGRPAGGLADIAPLRAESTAAETDSDF
jgi:hypothetical protein